MPRVPVENNDRMSLRIAAEEVIELSERQDLSQRDSLQVMDLLENPLSLHLPFKTIHAPLTAAGKL